MAQRQTNAAACELKNKALSALFVIALLSFGTSPFAASAAAREISGELRRDRAVAAFGREGGQEHPPALPTTQGHQPAGEHAAEGGEHAQSLGQMLLGMGWSVANFAIFVGLLYYFFNKPFREYLASRSTSIRKDLDEARRMSADAAAQLLAVDQKLKSLPGEIDALRKRGTEEINAEERRIAAAAAADRERLLEQTRREIDLQVRLAKKEILEHAADLSVQLATDRIRKEITPDDQSRIVDRYLDQVKKS
jgi:F-type H+-transporting ATPase subunit b